MDRKKIRVATVKVSVEVTDVVNGRVEVTLVMGIETDDVEVVTFSLQLLTL